MRCGRQAGRLGPSLQAHSCLHQFGRLPYLVFSPVLYDLRVNEQMREVSFSTEGGVRGFLSIVETRTLVVARSRQ